MSASDIKHARRTALVYLLVTVFVALFGGVYELFGHGVYSYFMLYAFAFPLVGGVLPYLVTPRYPGRRARYCCHSGIATLTVGSLIQGVLEIYGTTNVLTRAYWLLGAILTLAGILLWLFPGKE